MSKRLFKKKPSSFQIIIAGFGGLILLGTLLLMLPVSSRSGQWTSLEEAWFTSTSAVCVTGLVVHDTATYWSAFGKAIILILIQIGGLGLVNVTAFFALVSGRRISLFQRSLLQESVSAPQVGGIVKMVRFICIVVFAIEVLGAIVMMPIFCDAYGASGIWMSVFHSVSAFCNAGFDVMGGRTGKYSSLTAFSANAGIVLPICLLIIIGGIGFYTWQDMVDNRLHFKKYRMQSKVIITTTLILILVPAVLFFLHDFAAYPLKERLSLSFFQAVTPRTAGFNTADLSLMTGTGRTLMIALMLIGGSPGSTAGGIKTTTIAVLVANAAAIIRRKKSVKMFGRRIEDSNVKTAATLLTLYLFFAITGACIISTVEDLPVASCLFETVSAIGTVGLSLGLTPGLGLVSHIILILLMFFGRVGGLTLLFAAVNSNGVEVSQYPIEKIHVG
ncbi:MAG: Trk family potassium uptake protein [Clostridiales bacterium]|nr:Trk family potassium uptake protein [Clostridiales bacterium]